MAPRWRTGREVDELLRLPATHAVELFFQQVIEPFRGLEVRLDAGQGKGKGLFATADLRREDELFSEAPLVAIQHTANRPVALVCGRCFQHLESIERQIAMQLTFLRQSGVVDTDSSDHASTDDSSCSGDSNQGGPATEEVVSALLAGTLKLPMTDNIQLPAVVPCPGGCAREMYCSEQCAQCAWSQHHSLLCQGSDGVQKSAAELNSKGKAVVQAGRLEAAEQRRQRQVALQEFTAHADETNDVFLLAAKVVATVLLKAQQLLEDAASTGSCEASSSSTSAALPVVNTKQAQSSEHAGSSRHGQRCWEALQAAWQPFAMGHKAVWWECMALPADVEDEAEFREGIAELAADSLELLRGALYDDRFPALFDLRVWGSIIGMFELNNLNLYVPSPVQRWQNLLDDLPDAERAAVMEEIGTLLEALEEMEEGGCEGNAFYSLQSCINHSCVPNAHAFKRDQDTDGAAVILALRDIKAGEEITISYVDEEASLEERDAELADYGFTCNCEKCAAERLAQELSLP